MKTEFQFYSNAQLHTKHTTCSQHEDSGPADKQRGAA
jgi:hypothetical protein